MNGFGSVKSTTGLWDNRELLTNLTLREVRSRYKRTALGNAWSLVNPLATMLIYTVVFGFLLRVQPEPGDPSGLNVFALWLMCALIPWSFMSSAITAGMNSLLSNANLIKKVYFQRSVLVTSSVLAMDVTFLTELLVLVLALILFGAMVLPWLPVAVLLVVLLSLFTLGLALMLAVANVYFRDTQHFVAIALQIWFYLTPILYPIEYVAQEQERLAANGTELPLVFLFKLNPMEHFVSAFRNVLYDNRLPTLTDVAVCALFAAVVLALGMWLFNRYEDRLAEEL